MSFPLFAAALGLAQFAPSIAKWFGSEKGETIARKVVAIATNITGVEDPLQNIKQIKESPELLQVFQREILEIEHDLEKNYLQDRHNARQRDINLANSHSKNYRADIMVIAAVVGLFSCLIFLTLFSRTLPGEMIGIVSTVAGIFGACLKDAYAFEFGSSRGSREKDTAMTAILQKISL